MVDEGNRAFSAKDFELALERYQAAYGAFASAKILFNMAEAQRELGRFELARALYEQILADPTSGEGSPLALRSRERLAELPRRVPEETDRSTPPARPSPEVSPQPDLTLGAAPAPDRSRPAIEVAQPATESEPVTSRWWFWVAVGAAAVATSALVIGASAGGGEPLPEGELGASSTASWTRR